MPDPPPFRSNCWFFAFHRWWTRGGYIVAHQSKYGWWPHVWWSADLETFEDFVPLHLTRLLQRRVQWLPPIRFVGRVRRINKCEEE